MELVIYAKEDRLAVAKVLIDNGYSVRQNKRRTTPTGKTVEYFLEVWKEDDNEG